ncbi:MAG: hypothetical protein ACD_22C00009G0007 [uncultured bacterium]|nr:MAG: hypothetical protein ACD_22C00009G0007 [uncultured bacterium]
MHKMNISHIIEFATRNPKILQSALKRFFGNIDYFPLMENPQVEGLFNEWLMFDYKQKSGRTFLYDYYQTFKSVLDREIVQEIKSVIDTNTYQPFCIESCVAGDHTRAYGMKSGKTYDIYDKAFSTELSKLPMSNNETFFCRIAKVNDRWEIFGSNPVFIPVAFTDRYKKMMRGVAVSPKEVAVLYYKPSGDEKDDFTKARKRVDVVKKRREIEDRFELLRKRHHFTGDISLIVNLVLNEGYSHNFADFITDSLKLLGISKKHQSIKILNDVGELATDIWNFYPHKALKGRSPHELYTSQTRDAT